MDISQKTIADFREQWTHYRKNEGVYASLEILGDILGPLLKVDEIKDKKVADIGSGTGRIVMMLLEAGAAHVTAVEPSDAYKVMTENTASRREQITYIHDRGESLPLENFDLIFSIGVIQHIFDPMPTLCRAYEATREGGKCIIWVYGREGNQLYLKLFNPVRSLAIHLPHWALQILTYSLYLPLTIYIKLAQRINLPMHEYMRKVLSQWSRETLLTTIYDQLNPSVAYYYTHDEARSLLERVGFSNVRLYHRHGYSWTVVGEKVSSSS